MNLVLMLSEHTQEFQYIWNIFFALATIWKAVPLSFLSQHYCVQKKQACIHATIYVFVSLQNI